MKPVKDSDYNFFTTHGSVAGLQNYKMNEFNELIIPAKELQKNFDYIALGHFHKYSKLADNTFYSGSIESLTFTEADEKKGFLEIDISKEKLKTKFIEIKTRPMIDIKPIKCTNLKLDQVMKKIRETIKEIKPKEKTFRITLDDIPAHIYRGLDFNEIRKLGRESVHYEIKADIIKDEQEKKSNSSKIDALVNEFTQYIEQTKIDDKKTIIDLGIGYIEKIEARDEGK